MMNIMNEPTSHPNNPQVPTPSYAPHPAPGQPAPPLVQASQSYTDGLGIASIILAALFINLPGLIVGLIGASKAKKAGASPAISRIGWIINLIMLVIGTLLLGLFIYYAATHADEFKSNNSTSSQSSTKRVSGPGFSLEVPSSFTNNSLGYPDADVAEGDDTAGVYVMVYTEDAVNVDTSTTVNDYAESAFKTFQADPSFTNQTRTQLAAGTIPNPHGLDVIDYRMEATHGINKYVYYDRYIKTAAGYYMITTWTAPSELDKNAPTIKNILSSFRETTF
jgi:hypothetical protein